jgi:hypothetical protein
MLSAKGVHIIDAGGHVDPEQVHVKPSAHEEVTWFAHGNENATIVFSTAQGSPFQEAVFLVPAGGSVSSGPVKDSVQYARYKYTVVERGGSHDPEVIIDR